MKKYLLSILFFSFGLSQGFSQIDKNNSSVKFDAIETNVDSPTGFEMPAIKKPSMTNSNSSSSNSSLGKEDKGFDMTQDDGLMDYSTNKTPKYFTKDKEADKQFGEDQYLGDVKTSSKFVNVEYRDHEYVDGDLIRVFVNGDVVEDRVYLDGVFHGFNLPLKSGFNRVDFQALNQGSSGPNTAQLHVYDDKGNLISANKWNLLTGYKATIIIVKE